MLSANEIAGFFKMYISRKKLMLKFFFGMQINIEVFCKLIISFWVCATRHDQSTQHKFAYLLISPEKERGEGGEVVFLPANKQKFSTD